MSRQAAQRILSALAGKADLLLCAAGGSTPTRTYQLLAESLAQNPGAFHSLRVLKLDEWGGIEMDDPGSCETNLRTHLVGPLGVQDGRYIGFKSNPTEPRLDGQRSRPGGAARGRIDLCVS